MPQPLERNVKSPETPSTPVSPAFEDAEPVTVLYGYGKVAADHKCYIDNTLFVGGVARNVPYSTARHWKNGTRPDGKPVVSRVNLQAILPNHSTEVDFARVTGVRAIIEPNKMAAFLTGLDAHEVLSALGPQRAKELAERLSTIILTK